jgi:uncharacterized protein (TIRG00374 family)
MTRPGLSTALKVAVSGAALAYVLRGVDLGAFRKTLSGVDVRYAALAALLYACTQGVSTYRWSIILGKDLRLPYRRLLSIYFIGMFFNLFLPTVVGGDVVKGYYLYRESGRGDVALASIFMDRYTGLAALMTITAVSVAAGHALVGRGLLAVYALMIGGFAVVSLVVWVEALHGWATRLISRVRLYGADRSFETFYNILMGYKGRGAMVFKAFICSIFVQCGVIAGYYALARGLGMGVGPGYFFLFIPLATVVSMAPVTLSGLGVREGVLVYLFSRAGAPEEVSLALSLLWFAVTASVSVVGGIEYVRRGGGFKDRPV